MVLPRVLSIPQVRHVLENSPVDLEVFGFGGLCIMVEGRCLLSSYVTGESPNMWGLLAGQGGALGRNAAWSGNPAGGLLIDRHAPGEPAGYPTLCKGRFTVADQTYYAIEEPTSLNTLGIAAGVARHGYRRDQDRGSPTQSGLRDPVTKVWRAAIDACRRNPPLTRQTGSGW